MRDGGEVEGWGSGEGVLAWARDGGEVEGWGSGEGVLAWVRDREEHCLRSLAAKEVRGAFL